MTIDDLIAKYKAMSTKGNVLFPQRPDIAEKSNLQYRETADCLKELKAYRANEGMSENVYRCGYKFGYNKAIDDAVKAIKEEYAFTILEEEKIDEIAEQLKGAKQNERR